MRLGRWLVLPVFVLVMVSGCGDGSSAVPSPSVSSVTSAPSTPAPEPTDEPEPMATDRAGQPLVAPERPAAMDHDDEAGAQAAAEYFIELYGYATRSQNLKEFTELCDPASTFCAAVINEVTADVAAGAVTVGGQTALTATAVDPPGDNPFYVVWGTQDRAPFTAFAADGTPIYESAGDQNLDVAVVVERQPDDTWVVREGLAGVVPSP